MTIRELIAAALQAPARTVRALHARHINPPLMNGLRYLDFTRDFVRADGGYLWDADGRRYADFLSAYGSIPLGHNHPEVIEAVTEVLRSGAVHFDQTGPKPLAAALAARLAGLCPGDLEVCYFGSSGSEAVEGAIKLVRAATGRGTIIVADGAYHGTTVAATSASGLTPGRSLFAPLLPGIRRVPFGRTGPLEAALASEPVAAVMLEPIQGEAGIVVPPPGYLRDVATLCRRHGALLVLDEVQTGLGRTGTMFACEHDAVEPDVLLLAKALSGGLAPVGAYVTSRAVWMRAYGTFATCELHCSTYSGAPLAMAAAIATLEILVRDRVVEQVRALGAMMADEIAPRLRALPGVLDVRGRGLLWAVELRGVDGLPPALDALTSLSVIQRLLALGFFTQGCAGSPRAVRIQPPLTIDQLELAAFATALEDAVGKSTGLRALARTAGTALWAATLDRGKHR